MSIKKGSAEYKQRVQEARTYLLRREFDKAAQMYNQLGMKKMAVIAEAGTYMRHAQFEKAAQVFERNGFKREAAEIYARPVGWATSALFHMVGGIDTKKQEEAGIKSNYTKAAEIYIGLKDKKKAVNVAYVASREGDYKAAAKIWQRLGRKDKALEAMKELREQEAEQRNRKRR